MLCLLFERRIANSMAIVGILAQQIIRLISAAQLQFSDSNVLIAHAHQPQKQSWRADLSQDYQVVGPFPQEAREQYFTFPTYAAQATLLGPLNLSTPYPSHLADEGFVYWNNATLLNQHSRSNTPSYLSFSDEVFAQYSISFPDIRWDSIRATEGWAGLQHHVILRTSASLTGPDFHGSSSCIKPQYLVISAKQCSRVAVFDSASPPSVIQWYTGDIYAYHNAPPLRIPLNYVKKPGPAAGNETRPLSQNGIDVTPGKTTNLTVLLDLDYEIRLFGDPLVLSNCTLPVIQSELGLQIECVNSSSSFYFTSAHDISITTKASPLLPVLEGSHTASIVCALVGNSTTHVVPDFVDGYAYGNVIGVEITSCSQYPWVLDRVTINTRNSTILESISLQLTEPMRFAPSQTRMVSLNLKQHFQWPHTETVLPINFHLHTPFTSIDLVDKTIQTNLAIVDHISLSDAANHNGILLTYSSVSGTPASAVVLPPPGTTELKVTNDTRILLSLHGAGVMHTSPFWLSALPRPQNTWVLVVQGLTPWGLDWREASRADVCSALRALVLQLNRVWDESDYCTAHDLFDSVDLGQDHELHPIPVIAIGHSNGGQGSLQLASLFPDSIPALIPAAGYTSARLYVSTQHSRGSLFTDAAMQGIMRASLQGQDGDLVAGNLVHSRVRLVHGGDDENVPVWHSRERMVLVKTWSRDADISLTEVPGKPHFWPSVFQDEPVASAIKNLVAFPYIHLRGDERSFTFTVVWPSETGSMKGWRVRELAMPGRLSRIRVNRTFVSTTNVHGMSIDMRKAGFKQSDQIILDQQLVVLPPVSTVWLRRDEVLKWQIVKPFLAYPSGPLSSILTSPKSIKIIIPRTSNNYYQSLARRMSHNFYTYLKLNCAILDDQEALEGQTLGGTVIVIGGHANKYGLSIRSSPLEADLDGSILISGYRYDQPGTAALSLQMNHLYVDAVDESGYERALQAIPLRTGVPGPEWMIIGEDSGLRGYGGVLAAGFWNRTGGLSETMSYFS